MGDFEANSHVGVGGTIFVAYFPGQGDFRTTLSHLDKFWPKKS